MNGYDSALIIVVSFIFASLSWKFIEQPFRGKEQLIPDRNRLFVLAGFVMAVFIGSGVLIQMRNGMGERISPEITRNVDKAKDDSLLKMYGEWNIMTDNLDKGVMAHIVGSKTSTPSFALVGDSHASAMIPAIVTQAERKKISGYIITKASTPMLLGISRVSNKNDDGCDEVRHNEAIINFINTHPTVKTVILVSRWGSYIRGRWTQKGEEDLGGGHLHDDYGKYPGVQPKAIIVNIGLKRAVEKLLSMQRHVVLVTDVPEIGYNVVRAYYISARLPEIFNVDSIRPTLAEYIERQKEANAIIEEIADQPGVTLVRPERIMFDEHGRGKIMVSGKLLYRDGDHLSTAGALYVAPVFDEVFRQMAADNRKIPTLSAVQ